MYDVCGGWMAVADEAGVYAVVIVALADSSSRRVVGSGGRGM